MKRLITIAATAMLLAGCCKPCKEATIHSTDSMRVERSVVVTADTILVTLPSQEKERTTRDTVSRLSTDHAESLARINADGTLYHNLRESIEDLPVQTRKVVETRDSVIYRDREIAVPEPCPAEMTSWQRFCIRTWWWMAGGLLALAAWTWRKPLKKLFACCFHWIFSMIS